MAAGHDLHAIAGQSPRGVGGQAFGKTRQDSRAGLDQHDPRGGRIDVAEFRFQGVAGDFGDGAGHLDPGRSAADDHEGGQGGIRLAFAGQFGAFEGGEDAPADGERVLDALQAGREGFPIVVAEIGVRGAGGYHQLVIGDGPVLGQGQARLRVDARHAAHQHPRIGLGLEQVADRPGDLRGRQGGCRNLIKQRLEGVMVPGVDHHHLDRRLGQGPRRLQAREPRADDDHTGAG